MDLTVRRADVADVHDITELVVKLGNGKLILAEDILEVILTSILSICILDCDEKIVAFGSFNDTPCDGKATTDDCVRHMSAIEQVQGITTSNTLFLRSWASHTVGSCTAEEQEMLVLTLKTVLETLPETDYIVVSTNLRQATGCLTDNGFKYAGEYSGSLLSRNTESKDNSDSFVQSLWLLERIYFRPNLVPRQAQVEDYDDLVKIFDEQSQVLSKIYGEYFLAELIESQDQHNKAIVASVGEHAVGLMCLSTEIDVPLLVDSYQLDPYDNLSRVDNEGVHDDPDQPNVFAITLFCVDEGHKSRTRDILLSAFESFPSCDYCALTVPNDIHESALLPYFFSVPVRENAHLSHSLFLLHRDSLRALRAKFRAPMEIENIESKEFAAMSSLPNWVGGSQLSFSIMQADEMEAVEDLIDGSENARGILQDVAKCHGDDHSSTMVQTVLAKIMGQVVGAIVVDAYPDAAHNHEVERLDHLFDLRGVRGLANSSPLDGNLRHACLLHFVLVPIFDQFSRVVLRDVMRLLNIHALHYKMFPGHKPPAAVVGEMVQVRPRRVNHLQRLHRKRHLTEPRDKHSRFALFTLTKSALSEPRFVVNTRIVVIGASETGLSTLEELLMVQHSFFAKITLVSPGGVADERLDGVRYLCTQGTAAPGAYDARYLDRLGLRDRITIIEERMTYLERDAQAVVLEDGSLLEYDFLVLATGLQDTSLQSICKLTNEDFRSCKPLTDSVYSLYGDPLQATTMRRMIQVKHSKSKEQCIVYGSGIEAFVAVQCMLNLGKSGKYITMVNPLPEEEWTSIFGNDKWVASRVSKALKEHNVNVLYGLKLTGVERIEETGRIASAIFRTNAASKTLTSDSSFAKKTTGGVVTATGHAREVQEKFVNSGAESLKSHVQSHLEEKQDSLPIEPALGERAQTKHEILCGLFISAADKNVDPDIFASINDTGLVYDGRMVVDASFQTVDPRVFGAGTITKFSRKFRVPLSMEHFNSREVGAAVATSLLDHVDPVLKAGKDSEGYSNNRTKCSKFSMPKIVVNASEIPGEITYFKACRPGWKGTQEDFKELETQRDHSYCRLEIDAFGHVASVSYALTHSYFEELENTRIKSFKESKASDVTEEHSAARAKKLLNRLAPLDQLVGIHVSFLNDVEGQLERGLVLDLFAFLSQEWASALYHDKFGDFCRKLRAMLQDELKYGKDEHIKEIFEELKQSYNSNNARNLSSVVARKDLIGPGGTSMQGNTRVTVQTELLHFLREHASILQMYFLG